MVGDDPLWLSGVTAVIRRGDEVLLVRRADNDEWSPVTGIIDPGEEPAVCAAREAMEETGVEIRVDRLAVGRLGDDGHLPERRPRQSTWTSPSPAPGSPVRPYVADDESVDVRWWPVAGLPEMAPVLRERIDAALSDEVAARFRT